MKKKRRTQMIQFSYSSKSRTSTQDPEREDNLSPADAHDFEYGVYSRHYDNRTPLHIASPQGWIDVSGHLLIHGWIDMLLLPFMVFSSSSVSPIEDGSAKSNASIDPFNPDIEVYVVIVFENAPARVAPCTGKSENPTSESRTAHDCDVSLRVVRANL